MGQGNWDNTGQLTKNDGEVLSKDDYNDDIDKTTPPIGAMIPWLKSFTSVPQTLPSGWVVCDGSVISDAESVLDGETLPDLNGNNQFVRGNTTSGGTGGVASVSHNHQWASDSGGSFSLDIVSADGGEASDTFASNGSTKIAFTTTWPASLYTKNTTVPTEPPFFDVVWILRIK